MVSRRAAAADRTLGGQPRLAQCQATKCSMVPAKLTLCSHLAFSYLTLPLQEALSNNASKNL